jgi:hypothetical protein
METGNINLIYTPFCVFFPRILFVRYLNPLEDCMVAAIIYRTATVNIPWFENPVSTSSRVTTPPR